MFSSCPTCSLGAQERVYLALSLALLGLLSVAYAWDTYDLPSLVVGMLGGSETGRGGEAVAMAIGPSRRTGRTLPDDDVTPRSLARFARPGAHARRRQGREGYPDILARLTLLVWTLLLFFGSLTSYSGFPDRFERDLGVPLALLAALTLVTLVRLSTRSGGPAVYVAALLAVTLSITLVGAQSVLSLEQAAGPSARPKDRPAPAEVVAAGRGSGGTTKEEA